MGLQSADLPTYLLALLTLLTLLATYLSFRVWTPPNPHPTITGPDAPRDRGFGLKAAIFMPLRRFLHLFLGTSQALLILTHLSPPHPLLCPHPESLNPSLFTWSPTTITCLSLVLIFAPIRILAFHTLGPSFTFKLAPPKKLVTTGLYRYVQHPSYITNAIVFIANVMMVDRPDAVAGCFMPEAVVRNRAWYVVGTAFACFVAMMGRMRVQDEEAMLKKSFGREWEVWHARTKRFVPGVI